MAWSATRINSQLNTIGGVSQLLVTVKLDNGTGIAIDVPITLFSNDGRLELKTKILAITDGIDKLNIVSADLEATPQIDTSPTVVTDIQSELNIELSILNQIQNLVRLGKIASDDNVVTDQIQKFADVANKIIKPALGGIII